MKNQFIYTEIVKIPAKEADDKNEIEASEAYELIKQNSLNVELVIRSIELDNGGRLVLMDDLHERWQDRPSISRNGARKTIREKDTFQSEIYLSKEDGIRFLKLTKITDNE